MAPSGSSRVTGSEIDSPVPIARSDDAYFAPLAELAPNGRAELDHELELLDDWRSVSVEERRVLEEHGDRVYRMAGGFP